MKYKIIIVGLTLLVLFFPDPAVFAQAPEEEALRKSAREAASGRHKRRDIRIFCKPVRGTDIG
jgi:hypothetical protein